MMDAFLARYWTGLDRRVRAALDRALDGGEVSVDDGLALAEATGRELSALTLAADELRARQAGDVVTCVVSGTSTSRTASSTAPSAPSAETIGRKRATSFR
jgi:hypothetical protein